MNLKILLPFRQFTEKNDVSRIVAEGRDGWFGLLPKRLDCIVALVPGILYYETATEGEVAVAIDAGILVKTGSEVRVSVRRAFGGMALSQLHACVEREFLSLDKQEQDVRAVMAKLESGFIRRFARFEHE